MSQTKAQLIEGSAASELTAAKTLLGAGSAGAPSLTATGDTNTGIFFPTADTIAFAEGGVETVRIDSSGRVGIGITSPTELLHLSGASATALVAASSGVGSIKLTRSTTAFEAYASTSACYIGTTSATDFQLRANNSEAARIDTSGRLLVGTSSWANTSKAVFSGNSTDNLETYVDFNRGTAATAADSFIALLNFRNGGSDTCASIRCQTDAACGSGDSPGRLVFSTTADGASSPTERMRITSGGSVCIGSANSQTSRLSLEGSSEAFYNAVFHDTRTGAVSAGQILFKRNTATVGSISTTDVATAYNTSSDYRLKENVTPVTEGITRLQQLKPSRFNFIRNPDATVDGFLAHEVQTVVPEAISGEKDAVDDDGNPIYQGIDQSKLVPLLTAALQEAIGEIESLKARVAALESA